MIKHLARLVKPIDAAVVAIGATTMTLLSLGNVHWSVWFDEAFGAFMVRLSPAQIVGYTAVDVHPPFYYLVLKFWRNIFGDSDIALRSLSLTCLVLAMVVGYFLLRRLFGRAAASLATIFMAISPMVIRYSDEMRMYGLVALIAVLATAALVSVMQRSIWWKWLLYAVLIALGMWTHYFIAVVWVAHWVWRGAVLWRRGNKPLVWAKRYLSRPWLASYALAVVLYLPWVPSLLRQIHDVQGGFWIGKVGAYSFTNFFTNMFYYREHHEVLSWLAVLFFAVIALVIWLVFRVYRKQSGAGRVNYLLLICLTAVPPFALFLLSLPPLQSSFVERYLLTSFVAGAWLVAVTLVMAWRQNKLRVPAGLAGIIVVVSFAIGLQYVYQIGNYNKNTNTVIETKQLVQAIYDRQPNAVVLADSPWLFYEAVFYETATRPVFFVDPHNYPYGSLAMIRDDTMHRVADTAGWVRARQEFWYIGIVKLSDYKAPVAGMIEQERIVIDNPGKDTSYLAVHYKVAQ